MKKHISYRSSELLKWLNKQGITFFTLKKAGEILKESEPAAIRKLLSGMVKRGLILRLKDGLYSIIPYEKDAAEYFPDWHLTAEALVTPQMYYIGFYSALDIHGLITQPALTEQIVTEKQIVPKYRIIKKVKFEFTTLGNRFFGYNKTWIDDFNKVYCSDLEKTILDCLYIPGKANGIPEIIKAISNSADKLDENKVITYIRKYNSQAVIKRLGFILQSLDINTNLRDELGKMISSSYALLDSSLPKKGKHNSNWKIIDNSGIESAINSILT